MKPDNLSFKAYGLLIYIWQVFEEKPFYVEDVSLNGCSRMEVDKGMRELYERHYVKKYPQGRNKKGRYQKPRYQLNKASNVMLGLYIEKRSPDQQSLEFLHLMRGLSR